MVLTSKWGRIQPEIQIYHVQVTWRCVAVRKLPKDVLKMASDLISPSGLPGHRRQLCNIPSFPPLFRCQDTCPVSLIFAHHSESVMAPMCRYIYNLVCRYIYIVCRYTTAAHKIVQKIQVFAQIKFCFL